MGYTKFSLDQSGIKEARNCEGCDMFASCEELTFNKQGDKIWLCGNCMHFTERFAQAIANISDEQGLSKRQMRLIFLNWKNNKHKLGKDIEF